LTARLHKIDSGFRIRESIRFLTMPTMREDGQQEGQPMDIGAGKPKKGSGKHRNRRGNGARAGPIAGETSFPEYGFVPSVLPHGLFNKESYR